jgi:hypothetical protein
LLTAIPVNELGYPEHCHQSVVTATLSGLGHGGRQRESRRLEGDIIVAERRRVLLTPDERAEHACAPSPDPMKNASNRDVKLNWVKKPFPAFDACLES